jgi:antagonist of KipI
VTLRVGNPGMFTTVQDGGRNGQQSAGVPVSGAMDGWALRLANMLVGNDDDAAGLEITLTGPALTFNEDTLIALGGADLSAAIGTRRIPVWYPAWVPRGSTLTFGAAVAGCRAYLAIAGGIAVPPVLGSRSTYVRAAIGGHQGRALRRGDVLPCGAPSVLTERVMMRLASRDGEPRVAPWSVGQSLRPPYDASPVVRVVAGAHLDRLKLSSREQLYRAEFRVASQSDRMGYRLEGATLELTEPLELLSEAVTFGTIQLPPGGDPIVLMADRQTTGGYPRIGEVATVDLPLLAQLKPGNRVRFRACAVEEAQARYLEREQELVQAKKAIGLLYA